MVAPAIAQQLRRQAQLEPLVFDDVHLELCPALAEIILRRAATEISTASLNKGGWKSAEGFFNSLDPAVAELSRTLIGIVGARPNGWAMVNRRGSHHPRHQHRLAVISIVYYVTAGDPVVPTVFECTEKAAVGVTNGGVTTRAIAGKCFELEVDPAPGRLVVFPGEMWHSVPKYEGETPRITIAGDVHR